MATQKKIIGKLPVFRGEYNKDVVYYKHNIVTYLGSSFISTKDENMSAPCTVGDKEFILSNGWEFFSDSSEAYFLDERFDEIAEVTVTTDDEDEVNDPESDIVNEALRKTPQTLSKAEQAQARTNIGAASLEENEAFKAEVKEQVVSIDAKVSDIGSKTSFLTNITSAKLPNFSIADKTLTFYSGTILYFANKMFPLSTDTVINLEDATSNDKKVLFNVTSKEFSVINYNSTLDGNYVFVAGIHTNKGLGYDAIESVSCVFDYSIDGFNARNSITRYAGLSFVTLPNFRTDTHTLDISLGTIIYSGKINVSLAPTSIDLGEGGTDKIIYFDYINKSFRVSNYLSVTKESECVLAYVHVDKSVDFNKILSVSCNFDYSIDKETVDTKIASIIHEAEKKIPFANEVLDLSTMVDSQTINGITYTREGNTIIANGTATSSSKLSFSGYKSPEELGIERGKDYLLTGCPDGGSKTTYQFYIDDNGQGGSKQYLDYGEGVIVNIPNANVGDKYMFAIQIRQGQVVSNLRFKPSCAFYSDLYKKLESRVTKIEDNSVLNDILDNSTLTSKTINGVTFSVVGNSIIVNGTASESAKYVWNASYKTPEELGIERGKNYLMRGCPKNGSATTYKFYMDDNAQGGAEPHNEYGNGIIVNIPKTNNGDKYLFAIMIRKGVTMTNEVFTPSFSEFVGAGEYFDNSIEELKRQDTDSIENLNKDAINAISVSCSKFGQYGVDTHKKYNSYLIVTDIHGDWVRLERAFDFAEENEFIKAVLVLGDIGESSKEVKNYDWKSKVLSMSKPVLAIVGNHEMTYVPSNPNYEYLSDEDVYNLFYNSEIISHTGEIHPLGKNYFYKDIVDADGNTTRIIALYQFEWQVPLDINGNPIYNDSSLDASGSHTWGKDMVFYSQQQIDWFVDVLKSTPLEYGVIILSHMVINGGQCLDNNFNEFNYRNAEMPIKWMYTRADNYYFFEKILSSWVNGGVCEVSTNQQTPDGNNTILSVNTSFDGGGRFIANLCGHTHNGGITKMTDVSGNMSSARVLISNTSTAIQTQQDGWIPRSDVGKSQDCLNVVTYDYSRDKLKVIRVGATWNADNNETKSVML